MLVLFLFLFLYNSSSTCDSFHPAVFLLGGVRKWFGSVVVSSFLSRNSLSLFTSTQSAAGAENETPAWRTEVFQPQKCSVPCSLFLFSAGCIYLNWFEARLSHGFIFAAGEPSLITACWLISKQGIFIPLEVFTCSQNNSDGNLSCRKSKNMTVCFWTATASCSILQGCQCVSNQECLALNYKWTRTLNDQHGANGKKKEKYEINIDS